MSEQMDRNGNPERDVPGGSGRASDLNLKDPRLVLSLLEADQVVAAKAQSRFGRKPLSLGTRVALWALRIYVLLMLVVVAISIVETLHSGH